MDEASDATTGRADDEASPRPDGGRTRREAVEERFDLEHFSPADMAKMTVEEWEAAFDPASWITGEGLLRRVEAELRDLVARRELFAVVERTTIDGEERVLAYDDVGYATVAPDGTVTGEGSIVGDVEPVVALCAMPDYRIADPPADAGLPTPEDVDVETGGLGDQLLLVIAVALVVAGGGLLVAALVAGAGLIATVAGLGFLVVGVALGLIVANARLASRFRAEEYRERLRAAGVGTDDRPSFLPGEPADEPAEPTPD